MAEAQYTISGFNIAGLDPIEFSRTVTGATVTLTDTDIGRMNVFTGSANTTVALPSASGTLDGYSKAGRMIGLRGSSAMTAYITLTGLSTTITIADNHVLVLVSDGTSWRIHHHRWPPMLGYFTAYRSTSDSLTSAGLNDLVYNTLVTGASDPASNADGWYNTTTGIHGPLVRGYYEYSVTAAVTAGATGGAFILYLGKNGSAYTRLDGRNLAGAEAATFSGSEKVYLNGTSDSVQPILSIPAAATHVATALALLRATYLGPA